MSLRLIDLLSDFPYTMTGEDLHVNVKGITENSLNVKDGYVFVARRGEEFDGATYIKEAIERGAVAIVVDRIMELDIPYPLPIIVVPDCQQFISFASAALMGNPSEKLVVIAVTGTNGKTTVTHFVGQFLHQLGVRAAVIGTTGVFIDGMKFEFDVPQMTTLPPEYLHKILKDCLDLGVNHIVMEASSLGLSTDRLMHCEIDVGVLTNIGSDHIDEHKGKENYIRAKQRILQMAKKSIVNSDDEICLNMSSTAFVRPLYFGMKSGADVQLHNRYGHWWIGTETEQEKVELALIGDYNRMNALAAISVLLVLGYSLKDLLEIAHRLRLPEGRMQVLEQNGVYVVIDYAHTPDALEAVLSTLSAACLGKLITVFGCGGERDKGKREVMGELAVLYSSKVYVTSDNPRREDPLDIIRDITKGFEHCHAIEIEPVRELAIQKAILSANIGDIVCIAGKGHEKIQITADGVFPFSDLAEAEKSLQLKKELMLVEKSNLDDSRIPKYLV